MAKKEELEIHILKNGEVKVDVKGGKGKSCTNYIKMFQEMLGTLKEKTLKPEYYEQDPEARIDIRRE